MKDYGMPTYEYRCHKCHHEFEVFQSITEDPVCVCPVCAGPVERKISAGAGLIFKGSGFYITDYRSESYKRDAKKDKPSEPKSTETKKAPEKKPEKTATAAAAEKK